MEPIEKNPKKKSGLKGLFEEIEAEKKKKKNKPKKKNDSNNNKTKPKFSNISNESSDFKGLKNFGNSCYSNVIIQILTSIPDFINVLYKRYTLVENENDLFVDYPILSRVIEIISNYKSKNTSLATNYLKDIVYKFDMSGSQNDAHEFLVFLLDRLNIELLNIENKFQINNSTSDTNEHNINIEKEEPKENKIEDEEDEWEEVKKGGKTMKQTNSIKNFKTSILGEVFQGIIKQDIIQKGSSQSNCQIEPFFTLHLDNDEPSIENMFEKFFKKKQIEDSGDKYIQSFLEKCPNIFIVNAKGFFYDKKNKMIVKIKKELIFGEKLILKKEYVSPYLRNKNIEYELIGIVVHKGNLATEGHYICYCKDNKDKKWFYLDDNKVIKVSEDLLHKIRPYILFYKKLS
jgi:ubiquitin C-terminal hydrolase